MRGLPVKRKINWSKLYPKAAEDALDLLDKMLRFNPSKRISVEDALTHPYLATLHHPDDEPLCERIFDFQDNVPDDKLEKVELQEQILEEVLELRPQDRMRFESILRRRRPDLLGEGSE